MVSSPSVVGKARRLRANTPTPPTRTTTSTSTKRVLRTGRNALTETTA